MARKQNSSFRNAHGFMYVIPKDAELEKQFQKYKGRVVPRGDVVKDDSGSYAVFTAWILRVTHDCRQSFGCHIQTSWMHKTSSLMQYRLTPKKWKTRHSYWDYQHRMPNALDPSAENPPPKIMGQYSRSRGTSRKKFVRTPFCRIAMGTTI